MINEVLNHFFNNGFWLFIGGLIILDIIISGLVKVSEAILKIVICMKNKHTK
tara:strand:+ start:322 stop:477 length:156 start_codon:yes stop_codon:yes gene_type:complete